MSTTTLGTAPVRRMAPEPSLLGNRRAVLWYAIGIGFGIFFAAMILPYLSGGIAAVGWVVAVVVLGYDAGRMLQAARAQRRPDYPLVHPSRVERLDEAAWVVAEPGLSALNGLLEALDGAKDLVARTILFLTEDVRAARVARLAGELRAPLAAHLHPGEEVLALSQAVVRPLWIDARTRWVVVTPERVLLFRWRRGGRLGELRDVVARDGLEVHEWFKGLGLDLFSWVLVLRSPGDARLRLRFTMYWRPQALEVVGALAAQRPSGAEASR